jgi:hypothetical protein
LVNHLDATGARLAFLLNFARALVDVKRVVNRL